MIKDCGILVNASRAMIYASEKEDFAVEANIIAKQYQYEMEDTSNPATKSFQLVIHH